MKARTLIIIALFSILSIPAFSLSEFTLQMNDNTPFYLIMDGEVIDPNGSVLSLYDIIPGKHSLQVYRYLADNNGYYTKYVEILYTGNLFFNDMERVIGHLTVAGSLMITQRIDLNPNQGSNGYHGNGNGGQNGYHGKGKNKGNNGYHNGTTANIMSPAEFNRLKRMIRESSFEETRLTIAKAAIRGKMVTSNQVFTIMKLFSFESTRLEFAKWAYHRTSNRNMFYTVHRAFHFEISIRELNQYIAMHG